MADNKILTSEQIIRAWKDEEFRSNLTAEQRAALPPAPSDMGELNEDELEVVAGGAELDGCTCGCWGGTVTHTSGS